MFVVQNARSKVSFEQWISKAKYADWSCPDDIKRTFGSADLLGNGTSRVVFDVGGNSFRIICKYVFGATQVHLFVCWIGTHANYTKLCKIGEQYTINQY